MRSAGTMSATLEKQWEKAVEYQETRLAGTKYHQFVKKINYSAFQNWLETENELYGQRFLSRHVKKLGSVLEEFEVFVRSITTMVQGGGDIACIVWGSIQAVLDVSAT